MKGVRPPRPRKDRRWARALAKLVRQQARDDRRRHYRRGKHEIPASDLELDLDAVAAPAVPDLVETPDFWIFVRPLNPLAMLDEALARAGLAPCPACGRMRDDPPPSPESRYCEVCDAAGLDGRVDYPGLAVGSRIDNECPRAYLSFTEERRAEERRAGGGKPKRVAAN